MASDISTFLYKPRGVDPVKDPQLFYQTFRGMKKVMLGNLLQAHTFQAQSPKESLAGRLLV